MIKIFTLALLLPFLISAQPPGADGQVVTHIVHVRFASAEAVEALVNPHSPSVAVVANNGLRALIIRGPADQVANVEQAIKQLDVARQNAYDRDIEAVIYVIRASNKLEGDRVTTEMAPVVRQLKAVFPYSGYEVIDTMEIRSRDGSVANSKGVLKSGSEAPSRPDSSVPYTTMIRDSNVYSVSFRPDIIDSSQGKSAVQLNDFDFQAAANPTASVHASIDVQPGQKVVVGKTNIEGGEAGLFVVVSARVLD
jgi:hypothetical protein